jgi:hypothetical protein
LDINRSYDNLERVARVGVGLNTKERLYALVFFWRRASLFVLRWKGKLNWKPGGFFHSRLCLLPEGRSVVCGSMDLLLEIVQRIHPEGLLEEHLQCLVGVNEADSPHKIRADSSKLFAYGFQKHLFRVLDFNLYR